MKCVFVVLCISLMIGGMWHNAHADEGNSRIVRAWSDDGQILAVSSDTEILVYTPDSVSSYPTGASLQQIAISPNNRYLAYFENSDKYVPGKTEVIVVLDLDTKQIASEFHQQSVSLVAIDFHANDTLSIKLIDHPGDPALNKLFLWNFLTPDDPVAYSLPYNNVVATISPDKTLIAMSTIGYQNRTGKAIGSLWIQTLPDTNTIMAATIINETFQKLIWHPVDRNIVVTMGKGVIRIWDIEHSEDMFALGTIARSRDFALSVDGSQIVTVDEDNMVRVWETATGKMLSFHPDQMQEINSIKSSPTGVLAYGDDTVWNPVTNQIINHYDLKERLP